MMMCVVHPMFCMIFIFAMCLEDGQGWADAAAAATVIRNQDDNRENENWKLVFASRQEILVVPFTSTFTSNGSILGPISSSTPTKLVNVIGRPVGVACDARRKKVYWSDASTDEEKLYKASMDGNDLQVLVDKGLVLPEGVAYDWITGNVYAIDSQRSHIVVCGEGVSLCSILFKETIDKPRSIALEPNQGLMFWTDWGAMPAIMRAGMDGRGAKAIVSTELKWPNGICVDIQQDVQKRRVFWTDSWKDLIESANLDGSERRTLITEKNSHFFGIDVYGGRVFWSDWNQFTIASVEKTTGLDKKVHHRENNVLLNELTVCHVDNQPIYRLYNPCADSGCSHICTLSFECSYACICPVGMVLEGKKCIDSPTTSPYLYIADQNTIRFKRLHSIGKDVFESVTIPEIHIITAVTLNPTKNHSLILSDSNEKKIYQYDMSSKILEVLVDGDIDKIVSMDVDPIGKNLYWVDAGKQTVEMISLQTEARAVLMTGFENPIHIMVVPELGSVFLSKLSRVGYEIYKCQLNGDGLSIFQQFGGVHPSALTYENGRIYRIDKVGNKVHFSPVLNATTHPDESSSEELDSSSEKLESSSHHSHRMAVNLGKNQTITVSKNISSPNLQALLLNHDCSWENPQRKKCSHICFPTGDGNVGTCHCPDRYHLGEDGLTCVGLVCPPDQFRCGDGSCIMSKLVCDGKTNCGGGEDEGDSICGGVASEVTTTTEQEGVVNVTGTTPVLGGEGSANCSLDQGQGCGSSDGTKQIDLHAISYNTTEAHADDEEPTEGQALIVVLTVSTTLLNIALTAILLVGYWLYRNDAIRAHVHLQGNMPVVCVGNKNVLFHEDEEDSL